MTRILVVEDEDSFSDALGYLLGREGFDVCVADSGTTTAEAHGCNVQLGLRRR